MIQFLCSALAVPLSAFSFLLSAFSRPVVRVRFLFSAFYFQLFPNAHSVPVDSQAQVLLARDLLATVWCPILINCYPQSMAPRQQAVDHSVKSGSRLAGLERMRGENRKSEPNGRRETENASRNT
jgi:hypothetical protein